MTITAETIDALLAEEDPSRYRKLLTSASLQAQWESTMVEFLSRHESMTVAEAMYCTMVASKLGLVEALKLIAKERGLV